MFQKTKLNRCLLTAFSGAAVLSSGLAFGQAQLDRVEITGSSIKRSIASEGALPVTILKAEELRQQGVTCQPIKQQRQQLHRQRHGRRFFRQFAWLGQQQNLDFAQRAPNGSFRLWCGRGRLELDPLRRD
jgi:hypothetical protein